MKSKGQSIYGKCREAAGKNQNIAAEQLHVSVRTLSDYDTGRTIPGDDTVCRMVEIYNAPELAYLHLQRNTEVGRRYLPDLSLDELPLAVLRLQKENRDINILEPDLISIACDGKIDSSEQTTWEKTMTELKELVGAALSVIFIRKEERPLEAAK